MPFPTVTMATETIHNPNEPRHFMRIRPANSRVRVLRGTDVMADSLHALRVSEVGRDIYPSVLYIPQADVSPALKPMTGRSTHCPLKGDASYFSLDDEEPIAWTYATPLTIAAQLSGHVAFYADRVIIEETGARAADTVAPSSAPQKI